MTATLTQASTQAMMTSAPATLTSNAFASTPTQNNLLVGIITVTNNFGITPPSGWTLNAYSNRSTAVSLALYSKVAGPSEPTSWAWTFGGTPNASLITMEWSGLDSGTTPLDVKVDDAGAGFSAASFTSGTTPTTTVPNGLAVAAWGLTINGGAGNATFTNGYTWQTGNNQRLIVATLPLTTLATQETTATWTMSRPGCALLGTYKGAATFTPYTILI